MANRLKQLRESKGLSHEKLCKAILERYNIKISSDSLQNYEVADINHTKAYKNQGMRVEYLRCFADFYGVSADYLLGISDVQSPDPKVGQIIQYTGLSEDNVAFLHNPPSISCTKFANDMINLGKQGEVLSKYTEILVGTHRPENPMQNLSSDSVDDYIAFMGSLMDMGYRILKPDQALAFLIAEFAESLKRAIIRKYSNSDSL